LFEFAEAGTLRFQNKIYPADIFNGKGTIGGITVRCMPAEAQVLYHQGYEQKEKDRHDVLLLCKTFGISIPEEYEK
jgi:lincosamide nucleotidyltransferase A/C/D/E